MTISSSTEARASSAGLLFRDVMAAGVSRSAGRFSRLVGAGGGTSLPGVLVEKLSPGFIARRAARLLGGIVVVSGTNGKTTTASMIRSILRHEGLSIVGNESGSNMRQGVATALLHAPPHARMAVFEIDEGALVSLVPTLQPQLVVLTNVFRDQLDRYGEMEKVADLLRRACELRPNGGRVVANADDPLLWHTVERYAPIGFGVQPPSTSPGAGIASPGVVGPDAEPTVCPRCGAPLTYEQRTIAHLGIARCTSCPLRWTAPAYEARVVARNSLQSITLEIAGVLFALPTGGVHNAYNAAAAIAAAGVLGIPVTRAAAALETFRPRFGRAEELRVDGRSVWLVLMKNPAGAGPLIREIASDPRVGAVIVSVNDLVPDGRDISWIWDVDFERLAMASTPLTPSGRRAADVAVRLKYAGAVPAPARREPVAAIQAALRMCPPDQVVVILATYTAMLEIRSAVLGGRAVRVADAAG
jgi:UDP-N-acetylmuramyl tripeptide synthase